MMWLEEGIENEWFNDDSGNSGTTKITVGNIETSIKLDSFTDHMQLSKLLEEIYRRGRKTGVKAVQNAANSVFAP